MITVVTSVTDRELYEKRLKRSLELEKGKFRLIETDSSLPLSTSYNTIGRVSTAYVMFVHQDIVFLEENNFLGKIERKCRQLEDLGIAGLTGINGRVFKKETITKIKQWKHLNKYTLKWDSQSYKVMRNWRLPKTKDARIVKTLDDQVVIIPKRVWNKVKFDEQFPFHLVIPDYCMTVSQELKLKVYFLPLQTWRIQTIESKERKLERKRDIALFKRKWSGRKPVNTFLGKIIPEVKWDKNLVEHYRKQKHLPHRWDWLPHLWTDATRAKIALEFGLEYGLSTRILLGAMSPKGHVYSVDFLQRYEERNEKTLRRLSLEENWTFIEEDVRNLEWDPSKKIDILVGDIGQNDLEVGLERVADCFAENAKIYIPAAHHPAQKKKPEIAKRFAAKYGWKLIILPTSFRTIRLVKEE